MFFNRQYNNAISKWESFLLGIVFLLSTILFMNLMSPFLTSLNTIAIADAGSAPSSTFLFKLRSRLERGRLGTSLYKEEM